MRTAFRPRILLSTIPKSGTYLIASILENLGWRNTGLHFFKSGWQDYSNANKREALRYPERFTHFGNPSKRLNTIEEGSFAVSHLGPNEICPAKGFITIVSLRDLRTALPSYLSFIEHSEKWGNPGNWRSIEDDKRRLQAFLNHYGKAIASECASVCQWLPTRNIIFHEALSGKWGEAAQQQQLHYLSVLLAVTESQLREALIRAKQQNTLTKSNTDKNKPSDLKDFKNLPYEEEWTSIDKHMGYGRSTAKIQLDYLANQSTQTDCPLCKNTRTEQINVKDRYNLPTTFRICDECGHVFQERIPCVEWWNSFYKESYWPLYGNSAVNNLHDEEEFSIRRYTQALKWIKQQGITPRKILDIGSGTGGIFKACAEVFPGATVIGTDQSDLSLANNSHVIRTDWQKNEMPIDGIDLVIALHVFEHFADPMIALKNIRASLPYPHHVFIDVPNITSKVWQGPFFFHIAHTQYFSPNSLDLLVKNYYYPIERDYGIIEEWPWAIGMLAHTDPPTSRPRQIWKAQKANRAQIYKQLKAPFGLKKRLLDILNFLTGIPSR